MIYKFNTMNKIKRIVSAVVIFTGFAISSKSQVVDDTFTPTQLVQQVFLGQGVNVFNVTFRGDSTQQIGKFTGFNSIGIDSGIIISTGQAIDIAQGAGPNASTGIQAANSIPFDQDVVDLLQSNPNSPNEPANDAAILEFDFIPLGDSVRFDYVFGSEEYPEFVCSINDIFGMFLSGPGIAGPYSNGARNIALIPGTTDDVSIYNLNGTNSTGGCAWVGNNSNLYVDNAGGAELVYDGYTTVLRAEAQVVCGQTYHLKIAIADAGDRIYDSGVLLKARSLVSNQISLEALSPGGDTSLVEGCAAGAFKFFRPGLLTDTLEVAVTYTGTATNGVDFALLPDTIVFLPDSNTVLVPVAPIADGIFENVETITASIIQETCDGTAFNTISQTFYIVPPFPIDVEVQDLFLCPGDGGTLTAVTSGGFFPITYLWNTGQTTQTINVAPSGNQDFWVTVSDGCTNTFDADTASVLFEAIIPVFVSATSDTLIEECGTVEITFNILNAQTTPYTFPITIGGSASNGVDYSSFPTTLTFPPNTTSLTVTLQITPDNSTEGNETVSIFVNLFSSCLNSSEGVAIIIEENPSNLAVTINQTGSQTCPGDEVTLNAVGTGGTGNFVYSWSNEPANTSNSTIVSPLTTTTYTVTIIDSICGSPITQNAQFTLVPPTIADVEISSISNYDSLNCPGAIITKIISPTQGSNTNFTYLWQSIGTPNDTLSINDTLVFTANESFNYFVIANGICGKSDTSFFEIIVPNHATLTLDLGSDRTVRCIGDVVTTTATTTGGAPGLNFTWNNQQPAVYANQFSLPINITQDVVVVARDTCFRTVRDTIRYSIPNYAQLTLVSGLDTSACPNNRAPLSVVATFGEGTYTYMWTALSGTDPISSPFTDTCSVIVSAAHDYLIKVTDFCGTEATDTVNLSIRDCNIEIPNIFTPNGDGVNNKFKILGLNEYPNNKVIIFDRWGKKVKEVTNYNDENAWDGADADTGTYFYVVLFEQEGIEPKNGTVQLLR
jgi:gliding motility-associated-like protein